MQNAEAFCRLLHCVHDARFFFARVPLAPLAGRGWYRKAGPGEGLDVDFYDSPLSNYHRYRLHDRSVVVRQHLDGVAARRDVVQRQRGRAWRELARALRVRRSRVRKAPRVDQTNALTLRTRRPQHDLATRRQRTDCVPGEVRLTMTGA